MVRLQGLFREQPHQDVQQKHVSASALALAMLASFCRVPDLASSDTIMEKVPVFIKVRS